MPLHLEIIENVKSEFFKDWCQKQQQVISDPQNAPEHLLEARKILDQQNKIQEIEDEFYKRKLLSVMQMEFDLGENLPDRFRILSEKKSDLGKKLKMKNAKKNNNLYAWITINPRSDVEFRLFRKKMDKLVTKTCFDEIIYVYEQRSTKIITAGIGFHIHILAKRNLGYKPCKCRDNVKNSVQRSKICKSANPPFFDYQIIGEDFARDKLDYILGIKTGQKSDGTDKHLAQRIDKIWREQEGLEPYYGKIII